jgi:hypothetical protein
VGTLSTRGRRKYHKKLKFSFESFYKISYSWGKTQRRGADHTICHASCAPLIVKKH